MATPSKNTDRRGRRTDQLIRRAFLDLAREKGSLSASIQEITARADISRGTFYAHYADKYALIDEIVREEFRRALAALPAGATWGRESLQALAAITLEYTRSTYRLHRRSRELAPRIEQAVRDELAAVILGWLGQEDGAQTASGVISWAIFGAASGWSSAPGDVSAEQRAGELAALLFDGAGSRFKEQS